MTDIPIQIEHRLKAVLRRIEESAAFDGVMGKNFQDSISLKTLVRLSGMSERSLRDWFKLYTGESISRYSGKRRAEYAARIFHLFPETSKSMVSHIIGLNSSQAIYPFMRKHGAADFDRLKASYNSAESPFLSFRVEYLPNSIMFYTQNKVLYEECSSAEFEMKNWDIIDEFIQRKYPEAKKISYVGFAIDKYIENKEDEGIFISGILCNNISNTKLSCNMIGEIGWRSVPRQKYAVFSYSGGYEGLSGFYMSSLQTLLRKGDIKIDKSLLIMEKYLNSPIDTPTEELITEIFIPISN